MGLASEVSRLPAKASSGTPLQRLHFRQLNGQRYGPTLPLQDCSAYGVAFLESDEMFGAPASAVRLFPAASWRLRANLWSTWASRGIESGLVISRPSRQGRIRTGATLREGGMGRAHAGPSGCRSRHAEPGGRSRPPPVCPLRRGRCRGRTRKHKQLSGIDKPHGTHQTDYSAHINPIV